MAEVARRRTRIRRTRPRLEGVELDPEEWGLARLRTGGTSQEQEMKQPHRMDERAAMSEVALAR